MTQEVTFNQITELSLSVPEHYKIVLEAHRELTENLEKDEPHAYLIALRELYTYFGSHLNIECIRINDYPVPLDILKHFKIMYIVSLSILKIEVEQDEIESNSWSRFNYTNFKRDLKRHLLFLQVPDFMRGELLNYLDSLYLPHFEQ